MREYAALAAFLVGAGVAIALYGPPSFALGSWVTVVVLVVFAFVSRRAVARERLAAVSART
jgi:hypothetical protein